MNLGKFLFTYRRFIPVPFFVTAVIWANPRHDLVVFGALLLAAGELLRLVSVSYSGTAVRDSAIVTQELVTNGPYAYLRNPIYLGNILIYMGGSILSGAWLPYLLYLTIIFFSIHYSFCIRYEESQLHETFGKSYEEYLNMVPRFFPRLSAYPDRGNKKADLVGAIRGEASTFLMITLFLLLITLRWYFLD